MTRPAENVKPSVAGLADGGFVVGWQGQEIAARRFDANGNAQGDEFVVNTTTESVQSFPVVDGLQGGGFVIAWESRENDQPNGIYAQRYDADGDKLESEFRVNAVDDNSQGQAAVTALADGGFIVSWHTFADDVVGGRIDLRRFDADGRALGGEYNVDAPEATFPSIASLSNGDFVVVWADRFTISAQIFNVSGGALGSVFIVSEFSDKHLDFLPSVTALAAGGFVVSWKSSPTTGEESADIFPRRFDGNGGAIGAAFRVGGTKAGEFEAGPQVAAIGGDGYVITWTAFDLDGDRDGVFARRYDADGNPLGKPIVQGSAGDDTLNLGGQGDVQAAGQAGDDTYIVNGEGDTIIEDPDAGNDTVISTVDFRLPANIEILELRGTENLSATGSGQDNELAGNSGNNRLDGAEGSDTARFTGKASDYRFSLLEDLVVTDLNSDDGDDGSDTLVSIETLRFSDLELLAIGGEFRVNTLTADSQIAPAITALSDGGFVFSWTSMNDLTSSGDIFAKRYAANGAAEGEEITLSNTGVFPSSATLVGGGIVFSWMAEVVGVSGFSVFVQRFDADLVAQGEAVLVAESVTFENRNSTEVAALADGGYVVAWTTSEIDNRGQQISGKVFAQRFDANGEPRNAVVDVDKPNAQTHARNPAISGVSDGGFLIVWEAFALDSDGYGIYAQRFDNNSMTSGSEFLVNSTILGDQSEPTVVELSNGELLISWSSRTDDFSFGVFAQRYSANGQALGEEFRVDTFGDVPQRPSIAAFAEGGFLISWDTTVLEGDFNSGVFAQLFDAGASPVGEQFEVNTTTIDHQRNSAAVALADGGFVIGWQSNNQDEGGGFGVFAQQFDADGSVVRITITGTPGDDILFHNGDEAMQAFGLEGNDVYIVRRAEDLVIENPGEGVDTVQASLDWRLDDNSDNLTLTGDEGINGTGNTQNNILIGNDANNILVGEAGADTMRGSFGDDTYFVDDPGDLVIETGAVTRIQEAGTVEFLDKRERLQPDFDIEPGAVGDDVDQVVATVSYALTDFVENLTLDGVGDIDGGGNDLDNTVIGNSGDNRLRTGGGALDSLSGGSGTDTFVIEKITGTTVVRDTPGDDDTLDLSGFIGNDAPADLTVTTKTDGTVVIANTAAGKVELIDFFASSGKPITFIDFGDGSIDVSSATDADTLAALLGTEASGEEPTLVDDDGNYWDASIMTADGTVIPAADAKLFRTYSGALGRTPDDEGFVWWSNEIAEGRHDLRSMAAGFIFSDEFQGLVDADQNGNLSSEEFLTHMYLSVFGREPDEDGYNFWFGELETGSRTQTDVLVDMTQSNEYVGATLNATVDYLVA